MKHVWIGFKDLQGYLGVSRATLFRWIKAGMPSHLVGGVRLFDREEVDAWARRLQGAKVIKGVIRIPIDPSLWHRAKAAADRRGIAVDELVERALKKALARSRRNRRKHGGR